MITPANVGCGISDVGCEDGLPSASRHPRSLAPAAVPPDELIAKYSKPGPRYTSCPPVPYWSRPYGEEEYRHALQDMYSWNRCGRGDSTVSVYVHIPFCEQRCVFC